MGGDVENNKLNHSVDTHGVEVLSYYQLVVFFRIYICIACRLLHVLCFLNLAFAHPKGQIYLAVSVARDLRPEG